jgi:predicted phage terminase large subunit-like protein
VQKKEYRDKTERWLRSEVIPAIEETHARLILIGNVLHTDALMARLKHDPIFTHREYPLVDVDGTVAWCAKYPTKEFLQEQERKVGRTAWLREYLLKVVPPEGQEVKDEWIQYYDKLPTIKDEKTGEERSVPISASGVGIDLAISKKETADFTTMVAGLSIIQIGMPKIYILSNPTNERFSFHETLIAMKNIYKAMKQWAFPQFFIEDVAYQKAAIEEALRNGIPARAMKAGMDKRARLRAAATFIQNGTVLFPRAGAEDLITQLTGFGVEDHDDLVDAFVYLIIGLTQQGLEMPEVRGLL